MSKTFHGGDLAHATELFGEPDGGWQDLSTGVSPWSYPLGEAPEYVWRSLPADQSPLMDTASEYYGAGREHLLPVPGSQYAISRFPGLVDGAAVAVPAPGYAEHARCWKNAGHQLLYYRSREELSELILAGRVRHAVVINPNNPTGERISPQALLDLYRELPGIMLVDEAFADVNPELSLAGRVAENPRLYVLRSLGKFFGLAGVRLGFLLGSGFCVQQLRDAMDPWAVSAPALWAATRALADSAWHGVQRRRIADTSQRLMELLEGRLPEAAVATNAGLFISLRGEPQSLYGLYHRLGRTGVYSRWGYKMPGDEQQAWLRLGLADDGGRRLGLALDHACEVKG
ncbi:threonine-phosphate decarboxylase [Microbulbifer rhizosphaerae]|uniref:Cobalamin biosynthetic protein CobC n=1 Tax=Microbulbifer rhizosphaerae TaxID=1562603 RepID=A0A7W4WA90_9GAMM|nr:threonine-phosphate decarboxylase [Microbulbifer rhizosphaerae]MBB3060541.1 cobalamin biosynthetic protein CobC [Microbulbifer rhizosphaerae]